MRSGNLFTIMGLIHETEGLCQREEPLKPSRYSRISLSRSQPVSSVSVWILSPLDRLVRLCSWVYLNREHYQQLMRTTWPIRDCSKVVCLFINILQNSRLPISSQLDCQFQARIKQLSQTILWDISRSGNLLGDLWDLFTRWKNYANEKSPSNHHTTLGSHCV